MMSQSVTDEIRRHHLIDQKDLANIEHTYGLKSIQQHANNQQSMLAWTQEWKDSQKMENPILYYKLQGQ